MNIMRVIELDAANWHSISDVYNAILAAIGAPDWHGRSPDALIDSMIWGGINSLEPPYTIKVLRATEAPLEVRDAIQTLSWVIGEGRKEYQEQEGDDIEVAIEIVP